MLLIKHIFLLNQWAPEKLHVLFPKGQIWINVLQVKNTTEEQKLGMDMRTFSNSEHHLVLKWTPQEEVRNSLPFHGLVTKERNFM